MTLSAPERLGVSWYVVRLRLSVQRRDRSFRPVIPVMPTRNLLSAIRESCENYPRLFRWSEQALRASKKPLLTGADGRHGGYFQFADILWHLREGTEVIVDDRIPRCISLSGLSCK